MRSRYGIYDEEVNPEGNHLGNIIRPSELVGRLIAHAVNVTELTLAFLVRDWRLRASQPRSYRTFYMIGRCIESFPRLKKRTTTDRNEGFEKGDQGYSNPYPDFFRFIEEGLALQGKVVVYSKNYGS